MMTEQEFLSLVKRPESATLDFKAESYRISEDWSQAALIKDVLCMANTPRDGTSYIVLGVKKRSDNSYELVGLSNQFDGNDLQTQFIDRVYPVPAFSYKPIQHDGKHFGIIVIPPVRQGPCMLVKDFKTFLKQRQVFFRRDSTNDIAMADDVQRIVKWVQGSHEVRPPEGGGGQPAWNEFLASVHHFDPTRNYLLLISPLAGVDTSKLSGLGKVPWAAVFDFDPNSESSGALKAMRPALETQRNLQLVVMGERPTVSAGRGTYWFFARGLAGRDRTVETGPWLTWQKRYGAEISDQMRRLAVALNPSPVTCVILWNDGSLLQHLDSTLKATAGAFGESADYVAAAADPAALSGTVGPFETRVVQISTCQLSSGVENHFVTPEAGDLDKCILPSSSEAPVSLKTKDQRWVEEEVEVVHMNVGLARPAGRKIGYEFLRGAEVAWFELGLHDDVERDLTAKVKRQVGEELRRRGTTRINLYHAPGAGGTTVARRVIWDFHREFPCAILRRTQPLDTVQRLSAITALTEKGLLLMVDGSEVAERQIDELYDLLRGRNVPVVILQVLRRFTEQKERQRAFYLPSGLTIGEAARFVEVFARQAPAKKKRLEAICGSPEKKICTAFYFGLESFGEDFLGLEGYVGKRIESLSEVQKRILCFLALAHHYAQRPLPAQAFASMIGVTKSMGVCLEKIFPTEACELLIEVEKGAWRTVHDLVALEILEQVLWPGEGQDRRLWRQTLSSWAADFANFCRGDDPLPSEIMVEVARRTFIYRDNSELLGTEKAASASFSQLIEDIPVQEGALELQRRLVELFPEEAHFWAHLGRYYSVRMHEYEKALECINRAIALQEGDHVLHHMKGMALRQQVYQLLEGGGELAKAVILTKESCAAFQRARELKPDNEHGFISEVQLLTRVIDYAGQQNAVGVLGYLASPNADPYLRDCLERAEDLLEQVRRNREGEGASAFEQDCRAKVDSLYGKHEDALQRWDQLLTRKDVYGPPVRRQIVWTYLARRGRSWDLLLPKEVNRIVGLLEENLRQEPNHDRNLRLWVQAIRRSVNPPSIDYVIEKVAHWKASATDSLDAVYYLYVFHTLRALEGSQISRDMALRFLEECRTLARFRRNRTKSLEWLGAGTGINRLIHQSRLGEWEKDKVFWENPSLLARITGRISKILEPQSGQIEIEGGLNAFFVPAKGNYFRSHSENQAVTLYLGFSYDGLRAWEVKDAGKS